MSSSVILSELPEEIHLMIIDFLVCDFQSQDDRMKFLLSNDIEMALELEMVYGKQTKYKQIVRLLNRFWKRAIKQQFNLDEQWMKDYHLFIDDHFHGNMKRLYAALCHSRNILYKEVAKERKHYFEPRFSSMALSIFSVHPSVLISHDGCEKHKIVSMIEFTSPLVSKSDSELVNIHSHFNVTFFIDLSIDEVKVEALKDYFYNNTGSVQTFGTVISICRSDNEESFRYMIDGLRYCLEIRKTYRMPCFVVLNSMDSNGPHVVTKERIEKELKNLKIPLFEVFNLTSEDEKDGLLSCVNQFVHEAFFLAVSIENERERLIGTLEKTVKKKRIIQ